MKVPSLDREVYKPFLLRHGQVDLNTMKACVPLLFRQGNDLAEAFDLA